MVIKTKKLGSQFHNLWQKARRQWKKKFSFGVNEEHTWREHKEKKNNEDNEKYNIKSFMVYARDLAISWGDDKRYWRWTNLKETSNDFVEIVELLSVCWLEIRGKFDTSKLDQEIMYEVVFVVMMKDGASGWDVPVDFTLVLPDGSKQEHNENLMEKPRGTWIMIPAGEFKVSSKVGEVKFSLCEYKNLWWKGGLVIKGVSIQPKPKAFLRH